jgi:membrane protein YqaA with SNARE-associated domain
MPAASGGALLVAGLLVVAAAFLVVRGADLAVLLALGYPGVAVVMFFSSATVLLPAPGFATLLAATALSDLNPWALGLFAGFGSSIGELTGYLVGLGGRGVIESKAGPWLRRCEYFMRRWGFATILVLASIPNPFFDVVGVLAGSLAYPARRLWVACLIGNTIKYTAMAVLGESISGVLFQS